MSAQIGPELFGTQSEPRKPSFRQVYEKMLSFKLVGAFHAYQDACDLVMHGIIEADGNFVVPGPGAKKGLEILGLHHGASLLELTDQINDALSRAYSKLEKGDVLLTDEPLVLRPMDTEHTLCEFQKYERGDAIESTARVEIL